MDIALLKRIAEANAAGVAIYVSQAEGVPLLNHNPALISINPGQTDPADSNRYAAMLTTEGARMVSNVQNGAAQAAPKFAVATGLVLPKATRRGGGGAQTKYPFEQLEVDQHFFVADSDVEKGDAFKTVSSAVGSANQRFAVETGNVKTVTRAVRGEGNKAVKGPDGKNVTETVTIPEKRFTKKFVARKVEGGVAYGSWTAPANGAIVARVQ